MTHFDEQGRRFGNKCRLFQWSEDLFEILVIMLLCGVALAVFGVIALRTRLGSWRRARD